MHLLALQGLHKFTGGSVADDDDVCDLATSSTPQDPPASAKGRVRGPRNLPAEASLQWQKFFLGDVAAASHAIVMQKANGEAAHLAVLRLGGEWLLLCGSKNVHVAMRSPKDVDMYRAKPRFLTAVAVADALWRTLRGLAAPHRSALFRFMACTGFTAVFEILQPDYQHVEVLPVTEPTLVFIAWMQPSVTGVRESFCALRPDLGLRLAASFGLGHVTFTVHPIEEAEQAIQAVRGWDGREGAVVFYVDSSGKVLGLLKTKSVW
jgi:hypothetical protein